MRPNAQTHEFEFLFRIQWQWCHWNTHSPTLCRIISEIHWNDFHARATRIMPLDMIRYIYVFTFPIAAACCYSNTVWFGCSAFSIQTYIYPYFESTLPEIFNRWLYVFVFSIIFSNEHVNVGRCYVCICVCVHMSVCVAKATHCFGYWISSERMKQSIGEKKQQAISFPFLASIILFSSVRY